MTKEKERQTFVTHSLGTETPLTDPTWIPMPGHSVLHVELGFGQLGAGCCPQVVSNEGAMSIDHQTAQVDSQVVRSR